MKNNKSSIILYVLGFLLVLGLGFQLYVIPNVGVTAKEKSIAEEQIAKTNREIDEIKKSILENTIEKKNEKIVKDNVDIDEEMLNSTNVVSNTLDTAYNKKSADFPKEIDSEFKGLLADISKPVINQTGKEQRYFDSLEEKIVAYDSYEIDGNTINELVVAKYKSPPIEKQITGGKEESKSEEVTLTGFDVYKLISNLKEKETKLDSYLNIPQTGGTK